MLTLDYIEKNTLWYAKFETGYRTSGTYDEVKKYYSHEDIDEIDTCSWEHQPKELQEFYKSYYYALYDLNRHDLYEIKDFYEEWSKNPSQFKPGHKPVIGKLSEYIESLKLTDDLNTQKLNLLFVKHRFYLKQIWKKCLMKLLLLI